MHKRVGNRAYLLTFLSILIPLMALCVLASSRLVYFRDKPVDFYDFDPDELFVTYGLTRNQADSVKLGFAEHCDPPLVGLFGNHQFRLFSGEAFDRENTRRYFFNYWYANLSLPELLDYITYMDSINKLPKEVMLVQITTPNNDNGRHIINYNHELPWDLVYFADRGRNNWIEKGRLFFMEVMNWLNSTFRYSTLIIGLMRPGAEGRIVNVGKCGKEIGLSSSLMSSSMVKIFEEALKPNDPKRYCDKRYLSQALRYDGAWDEKYQIDTALVLNANPLVEEERQLKFGDEPRIAEYMRKIANIGTRRNRKVVFIIPPVYETARTSSVDEVFSRALKLVGDLNIVDDRRKGGRIDFFHNYDHPKTDYFRFLVAELQKRNLIPSPGIPRSSEG